MPPRSRQIVYVDTNVVIEATRTGCWKALLQTFDIRTVQKVSDEAEKEPMDKDGYVPVDMDLFKSKVTVEAVKDEDVLMAASTAPSIVNLDAGEKYLLARVATLNPDALFLTTGDKAAVKSACQLQLGNRLISLQELAERCGQKPKLREWFKKRWLDQVKTEFLLDSL